MSYFIFDLDQTLANLYSVYYFLMSLRLKQHLQEYQIPISYQDQYDLEDLQPFLDKAYDLFVKRILLEEESPYHPLGILRPGILSIMKFIHYLKNKGTIKHVLIYSNNSSLYCLEFIKDVIQEYVKSNRFLSELIHWYHPMRKEEISSSPNYIGKDWNTLRKILIESSSIQAPDSILPSDIYFFDDMNHKELSDKLENQYYKVNPYLYKASFEKISLIYKSVLYDISIDILKLFRLLLYIFPNDIMVDFNKSTVNNIVNIFEKNTERSAGYNDRPPPKQLDYGIRIIKGVLKDIEKKNVKMEKLGGNIKKLKKNHSTYKKRRHTHKK
jgi:hypothetical protein